MTTLPPLARSVAVGSTYYRAGDIPPVYHAKKITNPKNWEGGKVPNFDAATDGDDTAAGVGNGDAANAQLSALAGSLPAPSADPQTPAEETGDKPDESGAGGDDEGGGQVNDEETGDDVPDPGSDPTPPPPATPRSRRAINKP